MAPLRLFALALLADGCSCGLVRLYRSPSGLEALPWATSHASSFQTLDLLGFPPTGLWTEQQYVREFTRDAATVLGVWNEDTRALLAFACSEQVLDETHMVSLTVHPAWRGHGLARTLVLATLWEARAAGQHLVTLEVRESHTAAIRLYESCGLRAVGKRRRYYREPQEDALLLARHFPEEVVEEAAADKEEAVGVAHRVGVRGVGYGDGGGGRRLREEDMECLLLDDLVSASAAGTAIRRAGGRLAAMHHHHAEIWGV